MFSLLSECSKDTVMSLYTSRKQRDKYKNSCNFNDFDAKNVELAQVIFVCQRYLQIAEYPFFSKMIKNKK